METGDADGPKEWRILLFGVVYLSALWLVVSAVFWVVRTIWRAVF